MTFERISVDHRITRSLITALPMLEEDLSIGAIVMLIPDRARVRHLPI